MGKRLLSHRYTAPTLSKRFVRGSYSQANQQQTQQTNLRELQNTSPLNGFDNVIVLR
jgi:hypothetical protein